MLKKISSLKFSGNGPIKILYPGLSFSNEDTGIGSIGRIDHAYINTNTTIPMHPHVNDEILSYFRTGLVEHSDSEGSVKVIGKNRLMLMKAGRRFYHEEKVMGEQEALEALQIFIRPGKKDLRPEVTFLDLTDIHSENKWRLLASPTSQTAFHFSSETWIYDMKLLRNTVMGLPELLRNNLTVILYLFKGSVLIDGHIALAKRDALIITGQQIIIEARDEDAELVLFVTDEQAEIYKGGMYSGRRA